MLCSLGYINIKLLSYTFADQLVFRGAILASIAFIGGCAAVGDTPATAIPSTANELEIAVVQNVEDASLLPAMTKDVKASADNTPQLDEVERANKTEAREPEIIFDTSLWTVMRPLMTLDHQTDEKRVGQQLRWLQKHPEYWERLAPRMQRYLPYILHEVSARNLPAELALLPVIESALDPYAFSPYGASGLWQFMRPTAKQYGLQMNRHYDGRRDVIASTQAALDFLEDLHRRFDDWSLALAAYNAGGGTVSKAVRKGRTRDFFALRLPRETKAYVPRLLAISAIVADPEAFGIELPAIENIDPLREVALPSPYDVAVVANVLSIEVSEIYEYNPALRGSQWSSESPLRLILPSDWNDGKEPVREAERRLTAIAPNERVAWQEIRVLSGDTISEIADTYGVTSQTLKTFNHLDSDLLRIGQTLRVPGPSVINPPSKAGTTLYVVRQGDSLWEIARRAGVSVSTLVKLNRIGPRDVLQVGQKVLVPGATAPPSTVMASTAEPVPVKMRKIQYRVRRGDSLSRIAQRFSIRVSDIVSWNDVDPQRYLQPGQGLTLFIDVIGG